MVAVAAVVVAVLHPIELISFNFDFDELFHPSPVGHWFARFRFCHSYWWFWLWFCFYFHFRQFIFVECSSLFYFGLFCFVDEFCSIAIIYCSVCPFVRSVVWLPLSSLFSIYPHCVCTMVYRRIWTTTKTLLIEFRCVTIFEIIFQQIFDECVLYC